MVTSANDRSGRQYACLFEQFAPYVIPIAYLLLVLWLQPADRLGAAPGVPGRMRLLWDDFDWTAVAIRALNAERGRVPGVDGGDPCTRPDMWSLRPDQANNGTLSHEFFLEYPDTALWLFRLPYRLDHNVQVRHYGPDFLDICHYALVFHVPSNSDELALWRYLRRAGQSYAIAAILCMLGLIAILRSGYQSSEGAALSVFLLMCPATLYFTLNRFDILPRC